MFALPIFASALAAALIGSSAVPAFAAPPAAEVIVTEIAPDNTGVDSFEYVEVVNTSASDITVGAGGLSLAYTYVDSDDRTRDVPFTAPAGTMLPAGTPVVLWLNYTSGSVDTTKYTTADFRAYWAGVTGTTPDAYAVVPVTGQAGMANAGGRGIRVVGADGTAISWSFYPAGSVAVDRVAQFSRPADSTQRSMTLAASTAVPSPGVVDPAVLLPPAPTDPEPTPTTSPEPTTSPAPTTEPTTEPTTQPTTAPTTEPTTPADPAPAPDPALVASPLQITELLPDSTNVGSADGYEFIEVYNSSDSPIDWSDYSLRYLYPVTDQTNSSTALWPSTPRDVVIPSGGKLVLWVKNPSNSALGLADFNAHFNTTLTQNQLVDVVSAGMANGSARGMQIVTNTGFALNRAYYNMVSTVDDVDAEQGIQYGFDAADITKQTLLRKAPATPGSVTADQVPAGLVVVPVDAQASVVVDNTGDTVDPAVDFPIDFTITDDRQVRTVRLTVSNDVDQTPMVVDLLGQRVDPADTDPNDPLSRYAYEIPGVDLYGKAWLEYSVEVRDGTNTVTTETRRITVTQGNTDPVRLNVTEGQWLNKTTRVAASASTPPGASLDIDGAAVADTTRSLEREPYFAFEAGGVNTFFRNGVLIGTDILTIFDEGIFEGTETITTAVPLSYVTAGQPLTLSVWAGTKAAPELSVENNDDFTIQNLRLVLPDGRALRPAGYDDPARVLQMGDSAGKLDFYDAVFTIPDDAFGSVAHQWDTTTVADGAHVIGASAGDQRVERTVNVDNTAPAVTTNMVAESEYRGEFVMTGEATDAGSGVSAFVATLDGQAVKLPYRASSVDLAGGRHTLALKGTDNVGNVTDTSVVFTTPVEQPSGITVLPEEGAEVLEGKAELKARVDDPSGDTLAVEFSRGYELDAANGGVSSRVGTTEVSTEVDADPAAARALSADEVSALGGVDGLDTEISSDTALPYQVFDVAIPADAGADYQTKLTWTGSANTGAKVLMYVRNVTTGVWEEIDRHVTVDSDDVEFGLIATVTAADHTANGAMQVLVQHSEGFSGAPRSTRDTPITPLNASDTPRSDYDFTLGWESDTQYYNADPNNYKHQEAIHNFFLTQRDNLNLQYVTHTGDIVDNSLINDQWVRADAAYDKLDAAGLPYGVLAGNHDVNQMTNDYTQYSQWFGQQRFESNPWYGGSHLDNRGHYDLISAGGIDFIQLYMGWAPGDAEIAWMNATLAQYPERKAIINLHEYMLTTGGLGPVPQRIYDEVIATNPNVMMVMSGHYHDAFTRYDQFDDNADGVPDRTVTQMLFDYQGLAEGGLGYLRLMQFDNVGQKMTVRTYSPSLDDYDSEDPSLEQEHQEFVVPYATLGIQPKTKTLRTNAFTAEVQTTQTIGSVTGVASGTEATMAWPTAPLGEVGWYVKVSDPFGAQFTSGVSTFRVVAAEVPTEPTDPGTPSDPSDPTQPGAPDAGGQPGAAAPAGSGSGSSSPETLAATGADPRVGLWMALALLLAGLAGARVAWRRRTARPSSPVE
ncbi:hypothetical protein ASE64_04185 [Agreia sp. Leaf210]|nr:hypothetical protein ASE64_04185 [Agreia sp. Leaf210]